MNPLNINFDLRKRFHVKYSTMKIVPFKNKFYLYKQNSTLWKKNYMNNMNMPETE
jgi:hypothetical protein